MLELLWLIPALPLAGFVILALAGPWISRIAAAIIGVGSVGLSMVVAILVAIAFLTSPPPNHAYLQTLWTWIHVGSFKSEMAFYLDALSLVMMLVVTFVGFLIHLYSAEFMITDVGYSRFFAYMNLFVGSMLILILASDLLFLYLGWEGVGLCSYLLIGFWYADPVNGRAARKAFIVTRIGDTAMAIGLFLLFTHLGTLQIQEVMHRALSQWPVGSGLAVAAAAMLLGGAVGKSAQLPLQTWLPDAMAGPTPASALIHAATMVTAGVYLIARTHVVFSLAPSVQFQVAVIGAVTLLIAGFSALVQSDIKRVLAYSTISQIGYMFLALGVGAWSAAIFHFMIHAFFKSLLFLGAGAVILALHHEHNMFKMGGLRKELPITFWTFLIAAASLSALPLVTAGFYSKDLILSYAWSSTTGSPWLWCAGVAGALLTSLYSFRMVFLVFFSDVKLKPVYKPGLCITLSLVILAGLSLAAGFLKIPFTDFLHTALPVVSAVQGSSEWKLQAIAGIVSLAGVYLAYLFFLRKPQIIQNVVRSGPGSILHRFWFVGWGFDWIYDTFLVNPFVWISRLNKNDFIDIFYDDIAWLNRIFHRRLSDTQTGQVRWYAAGITVGAIIVIAIVVFL
ncbi:MAG: NADH-quinone oxidoreductase subunit L [Phycisphaerae bacterium]